MADAGLNPVRDALESALDERCERLKQLLPSQSEWDLFVRVIPAMANPSIDASTSDFQEASQVWQKIAQIYRLVEQVKELDSWLHPALNPKERERGAMRLAALLQPNGMDFGDIEEAVKSARSRPRGAPVKRRRVAVRALEMRRLQPRLSWIQVTRKCCNCEKKSHDASCMQVVRQEVMALEKVLQRYNIRPESPLDTCHEPANQAVKKTP